MIHRYAFQHENRILNTSHLIQIQEIISNRGTSILPPNSPVIAASQWELNFAVGLRFIELRKYSRKFKYVGRYFELCSSQEKIRMYRMFLESDCSLTYCRYQLKLKYQDQL